jgi:hypothetical protein
MSESKIKKLKPIKRLLVYILETKKKSGDILFPENLK